MTMEKYVATSFSVTAQILRPWSFPDENLILIIETIFIQVS